MQFLSDHNFEGPCIYKNTFCLERSFGANVDPAALYDGLLNPQSVAGTITGNFVGWLGGSIGLLLLSAFLYQVNIAFISFKPIKNLKSDKGSVLK